MITQKEIEEIISLYKKHGWVLSRVLLSAPVRASLNETDSIRLFGDAEVSDAAFDAVWFNRDRQGGGTAWEIRHLSATPYARCESFHDSTDEKEIEEEKRKMENMIQDHAS